MIGYEYEFQVREGDKPLTKATFLKFHEELKKRGYGPVIDPDTKGVLGSVKNGVTVVTDDGVNNMEIEMPPTETVVESHTRLATLLDELQRVYATLDASIIGTSVFPGPIDLQLRNEIHGTVTSRHCSKSFIYYVAPYRWRESYWTQLFSGIHAWLDLPNDDIIRHLSVFNRLNPFFVALFANGPLFNEKPVGALEGRNVLWMKELHTSTIPYDSNIYGMYPNEYGSIFDYLDFVLDMPFYFGHRGGNHHGGISFRLADSAVTLREFVYSKGTPAQWGHGGEFMAEPTLDDFAVLQNFTFLHARLKFFYRNDVKLPEVLDALKKRSESAFLKCFRKFCVEIRTASSPTKQELSTAPALYLGIQNNLEKTAALVGTYSYDFLGRLYNEAEKKGLGTKLDGVNIAEVCRELIAVAEEGLKQRGFGEEKYLEPLKACVAKRKNPAQELLKIWKKDGLAGIWKARDF